MTQEEFIESSVALLRAGVSWHDTATELVDILSDQADITIHWKAIAEAENARANTYANIIKNLQSGGAIFPEVWKLLRQQEIRASGLKGNLDQFVQLQEEVVARVEELKGAV